MSLNSLVMLEHGGVCRLLAFLLDHPEGIARAQYRQSPLALGSRAADRDHLLLFEAQLIHAVDHPKKLLFGLTEKGKQVALKLREIANLLKK
ncbi:MAG: hypothetical protein RBG13Loki_0049 [Promethearchaeota archaeon CR_4]|nr:MAG: hypothetical protein RBG13Loki_0049 [Candidatus Lokiarchaeota archaeon CR_4]